MKKRQICIGLISLAMMSLVACNDTKTSEAAESQTSDVETSEAVESQASDVETSEAVESQTSESETYRINKTSMEGSTDSEYEISDMLPRLSDDTFIMTVEEAEAFMNKNANKDTDAEVEELNEPEE